MAVDLKRRLESWIADPQLGSPLFGRLHAEIRLDIFELALLTQDIFLDTWLKYENADSCSEPPNFCLRHDHDGNPDDDV